MQSTSRSRHTHNTFLQQSIDKKMGELMLSHCTLRPVSGPRLLLGSEAFIYSAPGCRCLDVFLPQACLTCFTSCWQLQYSKTEQYRQRGPSGSGSDEFIWKYMYNVLDTVSTHVPAARYVPHPCHVCHIPKKIHRENFRSTAPIRKICKSFLPRKFPAIRYWDDCPGWLHKIDSQM